MPSFQATEVRRDHNDKITDIFIVHNGWQTKSHLVEYMQKYAVKLHRIVYEEHIDIPLKSILGNQLTELPTTNS